LQAKEKKDITMKFWHENVTGINQYVHKTIFSFTRFFN